MEPPEDYQEVELPFDIVMDMKTFVKLNGAVIAALKKSRKEHDTPMFTLASIMRALEDEGVCIRPYTGTPSYARDE